MKIDISKNEKAAIDNESSLAHNILPMSEQNEGSVHNRTSEHVQTHETD